MNSLQIWVAATRPKTLIASVSPILIGSVLALSHHSLPWEWCICLLITGLGIQIGTNLCNDYYDFLKGGDSAQRKGPLRVTAAGLVSQQTMRKAIILTCIMTIIAGLPLVARGGLVIAFLLAGALLLGWMYTGGPYPLAYLGLGECFVFPFFGPVATACAYFLLTRTFSWEAGYAGIAPGLFSTALLIANNMRDVEEDRKTGKRTLVVRFGTHFGIWEYGVTSLFAILASAFFWRNFPWTSLTLALLIPASRLVYRLAHAQGNYHPVFSGIGMLFWAYTLLFSIGVYLG